MFLKNVETCSTQNEPFTQSAFVTRLKCEGKVWSNKAADRKLRDFVNRFEKLYDGKLESNNKEVGNTACSGMY